jgi:hypothetical protein
MTIKNITTKDIWLPRLPVSGYFRLKPAEVTTLNSLDPEYTAEVIKLINDNKIIIVSDGDIENYSFNEQDGDDKSNDLNITEIEESFNNVRFKDYT